MTEDAVRQATLQAMASWQQSSSSEIGTSAAVHSDCAFFVQQAAASGSTTKNHPWQSFRQTSRPMEAFLPSGGECKVEHIRVLTVGHKGTAAVQVSVGDDGENATNKKDTLLCGFIVMLCESGCWKAISVALAPLSTDPILPQTFQEVTALTWDGYCRANRLCDGDLMAEFFHETCRLTYVGPDDTIQIFDAAAFCDKVRNRYLTETPHLPYAHLQHETALISQSDTLLAIDFVSPDVAMVILKVSHPPFLWTDVLTCARCENNRWWIVHKSSESEPFLLEHAKKV